MDNEPDKNENLQVRRPLSFEFVEPEDGLYITYANHHVVGSTAYDLRLIFGELIEADMTEEKLIVEQRVHVSMSWAYAKILAASLQARIEAYEKINGEIKPVTAP